jgi:Domain of unknown function (DUF5666)
MIHAPVPFRARLRRLLTVFVFALSACSGTGVPTGVGGQGTGAVGDQYGGVSGLGSVVVEGNSYEDSSSTVRELELDPAVPASITDAAIKLGMQAQLSFDEKQLIKKVRIAPTLIGAVDRKGGDFLIVIGQTVKLNTSVAVVFEGLSNFSELEVGDRLEVHGYLDASGQIIATRIERLDPNTPLQSRVTGLVSSVQSGGSRLQVGELLLDLTGTALLPGGTIPAAGQRLAAWASSAPVAGRLTPKTVSFDVNVTGSDLLRSGGVIRSFDRNGARFRIGAVQIDFSSAVAYLNGSSADLADGKVIRVKGQASNGLLRASEISFIQTSEDIFTELTGTVDALVSSASFKVRNATVDASAATIVFRNGNSGNLVNGALVKLEGRISDGIVRASRVEFITSEDSRSIAFRGIVSNYNSSSGAFSLLGVSMRLDGNAKLTASNGSSLPRGSFSNGDFGVVSGSFVSGVFVVTAAELVKDNALPTLRTEGPAYLVNLGAQTLRVNGQLVRWNASTRIDGNLNDLKGGVNVRVEGTIVLAELLATRLTIRPSSTTTSNTKSTATSTLSSTPSNVR